MYLSLDKAKAGVEIYAERGGHGPVRWVDRGAVQYAYPAGDDAAPELCKVVPLGVRTDEQPEP